MIRRAIKLICYTAALGSGALLAWAVARPAVEGSGVPATEERAIDDVTEVTLSGIGHVTVVQGDFPSVTVTADDNILPHLVTESKGGKLQLRTRSSHALRPKEKIRYTVTVKRLDALTLSGAGSATVQRVAGDELAVKLSGAGTVALEEVTYKALAVNLSGAGKLTASGTAGRTKWKLSGAGQIDAADLRTTFTDVQISGAGKATVWATGELKARVSGAGGVRYKGDPAVEQKVSGAGRIRPLE